MCGRYAIGTAGDDLVEAVGRRFGVTLPLPAFAANYNAAPTQRLPVVVEDEEGRRRVEPMRWGLIPRWSRDPLHERLTLFNARAETVAEKPAFKRLVGRRRCLVPAAGFYEWRREGKTKQPYYFTVHDRPLLALAGLYDLYRDAAGDELRSYTILTTRPNELLAEIHDRMPVILPQREEGEWLSRQVTDPARLERLYAPYPAEEMVQIPVSTAVNSARRNGPEPIVNSQ